MPEQVLEVCGLGPIEARRGGQALALGPPLRRALLALLVQAVPRAVSVEQLIDDLWPAGAPRDPLRNLQVHVSALRRVLGGPEDGGLRSEGRSYVLDLDPAGLDVTGFESAAARARAAQLAGRYDDTLAAADEGLGLWRGDAWADVRHLPAIEPAAVRLDGRRVDLQALRAEALLALGRHREVVPELEELVLRHPLREDLAGSLMLALHRSGRQADALTAYSRLRATKAEETGLDPGRPLADLHRRILADDDAVRVEDADLRARRRLPAPATRLFGRSDAIADVVALLREPGVRLVTLTGPGGIGKTRLGLAASHELAADHPDGVWFVGLADVRDPSLVPQVVAEALGVEEAGDFLTPLRQHLAGRRILLLLDNFEQVDDAAPVVAELIAAGDGVRVLVTSRRRLRLYGEHVREVDPLDRRAAVPMFVARAREVAPWFDESADDAIAGVCDALDRVPLALELVAARADEIPLADMVRQLDDRLDLAAYDLRDRAARQRSLRGAIAWSVDLLAPAEAAAFARLGVFVGGFEPAAALEVAGADADVLAGLARASLVREDGGEGRLTMLETVREYALEALADELAGVADAHARWQLRLAEDSVEGMRSPERTTWLRRLGEERGNMRAALAWLERSAAADDHARDMLLRLAGALGLYWYRTTPGSEDVEWLRRALAAGAGGPPLLVGRVHYALAINRAEQGRATEALEHSREAHARLDEAHDPGWVARALNTLAGLTRDLGRPDEAVPIMEEAIDLRRRLADPSLPLTLALANRAMAALDLGDAARARECLEECLVCDDDPVERALVHRGLADVALAEGRPAEAVEHLRAALGVLRPTGQTYRLVECLETLAALAVQRGRAELAATLLAAADRELADDGAVLVPADAAFRERRTGAALAALPADVREAARGRGADLSLDDALDAASCLL